MYKCFCLPGITAFLLSICLFVLFYFIYLLALRAIGHFLHNKTLSKKYMRYPLLFLAFEAALALSISLFPFSEDYHHDIERIFNIVIVATIGWVLAAFARLLFQSFLNNSHPKDSWDLVHRSHVTQTIFLYRFAMFFIVAVTFSTILMMFPYIRSLGIGILGSAGIAGIALGIAARPILLNLISGFQIAFTKTINIGDTVMIEGELSNIESIHLTHVIGKTSDLRRLIIPISFFVDKSFQNWDLKGPELVTSVDIYCDYAVPVDVFRKKVFEILKECSFWDQKSWKVEITNLSNHSVVLQVYASAKNAENAIELRSYMREKIIEFLRKEYPESLPCVRQRIFSS